MPLCNSCAGFIIWGISSKTGKRIPIDEAPTIDGTLRVQHCPGTSPLVFWPKEDPPFELLPGKFTSHFATCPYADKHRRAR